MSYGLKIYNTDGESKVITPDDGTVIAAGSKSMSNSLNGDNTYGEDISLGGTYNEDELSVLVVPRRPNYHVDYKRYIDGSDFYYNTFYLDDNYTYYTRNESTGVMSSFSVGDLTTNDEDDWQPVLSVFPIAFWDKMGSSSFSSIRLFAGTCYLIRDVQNSSEYAENASVSCSGDVDEGSCSDVNDGNNSTYIGTFANDTPLGGDLVSDVTATVTFPSQTIIRAEMRHSYETNAGYDSGSNTLSLKVDGNWVEVFKLTWRGYFSETIREDEDWGYFKNCTGIRYEGHANAERTDGTSGSVWARCYELRAYGIDGDVQNQMKKVYTIGSNGIDTVDYMVARKEYS